MYKNNLKYPIIEIYGIKNSGKEEQTGLLQTVFKDGKLVKESSLQEIRDRILKTIN